MKIQVTEDQYVYSEGDDLWEGSVTAGFAGIIAEVGKGLIDLQKKVDELIKSHEAFKFFDSYYASGILMEIDGVPAGVVRFVDDMPMFVPFNQERVQ